MFELFRAKRAGDPKICKSNFIDRGGPLTETILLGNLAVWAAAKGGANGEMGDWGEKVEWNAKESEGHEPRIAQDAPRGGPDQADLSDGVPAPTSRHAETV